MPLQTFWKTSAVYTYLFHLFPPKQLERGPGGNPSYESSAHIPDCAASWGTSVTCSRTGVNVDKHLIVTFNQLIINSEVFGKEDKNKMSFDVIIPTDPRGENSPFYCTTRSKQLKK